MHLKIGNKAPDFIGKDEQGKLVSLSDFKDKKLILYFYPKDNTPGCTMQACNLRDHYQSLQEAGYEILGVSTDGEESHKKFINQHQLPFRLLVDQDYAIHEKYGTSSEKSFLGKKYRTTARTTFVIDKNGIIEQIIEAVKASQHAAQILNTLS